MLFPLRKEEKTEKYPLGPIKFPSLHLKDQLERSMIKIRANECLLEKFLRVELICIRALLSTVKLSEADLIFGSDGFDDDDFLP